MEKQSCVYIMSNKGNTVLYTGVTSDIASRIEAHKGKFVESFTRRYNLY
ncbi:MAG: GIY-YIG nuclease family protein [Chloroflexi bacterium]|nr:GIY-YIG nuclease family protein [Chloroflexota bacterium]